MAEKIYVGQGQKVGQYGNVSFSICLDDVEQYATASAKNGKKYVNLIMSEMKTANQWGKTHSVAIDEWKPDPNYKKPENTGYQKPAPDESAQPEPESNEPEINVDDIPF
jgi:hypothetical protein